MPEVGAPPLPPPRPRRERRVQVYVSHDVADRLDRLAARRGETVSYVAGLLLGAAIAAQEVEA